jgi:hypothetical protein
MVRESDPSTKMWTKQYVATNDHTGPHVMFNYKKALRRVVLHNYTSSIIASTTFS